MRAGVRLIWSETQQRADRDGRPGAPCWTRTNKDERVGDVSKPMLFVTTSVGGKMIGAGQIFRFV